MTRTFHSIGQGGFYTEKFDDFTMVYDCGGSTKQTIEEKIKKTFVKDQKIDAVFISHFHNDHVNGLKFLLEHCNVKTVYLPLLNQYSKIQLMIENIVHDHSDIFINSLIDNPTAAIHEISRDTNVVFVSPLESSEKPGEDAEIIQSGQKVPLANQLDSCNWVFIPYNFENKSLSLLLVDALKKAGIDTEDLANELKTKQDQIIDIYEDVLGGAKNFNANSLVLYSGPEDDKCTLKCICFTPKSTVFGMHLCASLYLGDYNVKEESKLNDLKTAFITNWDLIGVIQIPHHGSKHNFNQKLVKPNIHAIISAGQDRKHPHGDTLKGICAERAHPLVVTEDPDSEIVYTCRRF
ncbi:MAG: MBL fold metallo-hydrolase [Bacteroidales bacterium]|nr:MBL fold metallo-hydrolase [Bacteroidales bacterium]